MSKKSRPKTTVNVDAVKKEVSKLAQESIKNNPTPNMEVAPGSVRRQSPLEQEMGTTKYRKMIHDHNQENKHILDRLPFTFPKKRIVRSHRNDVVLECVKCGYQSCGSEFTYMKICAGCQKPTKVINPEAESRGEDRNFVPGFLATAEDILRMKEERDRKESQ